MAIITSKTLQSAAPKLVPYFIRDDKVKGFAAKVNPSGSSKLIAEVRHEGRNVSTLSFRVGYVMVKLDARYWQTPFSSIKKIG